MNKVTILIPLLLVLFSCSKNEVDPLIGKWKLTEELIDIGDGQGQFKKTNAQQTIEFFRDGTFSSSTSFCPMQADNVKGGKGTYSLRDKKLVQSDCPADSRGITFESKGRELILNLACIEPCKQKYSKMEAGINN